MASTREIRIKINATTKTKEITKAMHSVSASKLKKTEKILLNYRPMVNEIEATVASILESTEYIHPLVKKRKYNKVLYILIGSDRGLCGSYNNNLFKHFDAYVERKHHSKDDFLVGTIGFKAYTYAKKRGYNIINDESITIRDDIRFIDYEKISKSMIKLYEDKIVDRVVVFYSRYINTINQKTTHRQIVPIRIRSDINVTKKEYIYEPNVKIILDGIIPLFVDHLMYEILLEAKTSEHASRMTSMKNASDNADEIIGKLRLHYNRARQGAITTELTDIIGGANAVS